MRTRYSAHSLLFIVVSTCLFPTIQCWAGLEFPIEEKFHASDGAENDQFGGSVAISGKFLVVGANQNSETAYLAGAAYIFEASGDSWVELQKITPEDAAAAQRFGESVSIDGNRIAVSAANDGPESTGAVYTFVKEGSHWIQEQKIVADDPERSDQFGVSLDLQGNRLVIGAPNKNETGPYSGAVYVFVRTDSTWSFEQKLLPSDPGEGDKFGEGVSVDGDTIAIGADNEYVEDINVGSVYIFKKLGDTWVEQTKILPSDVDESISFGRALDLENGILVAGAARANVSNEDNSGAAYVFTGAGPDWHEETKLFASDVSEDARFGTSISLKGNYLAIGAIFANSDAPFSGACYLFKRAANGWFELDKITASDASEYSQFGISVAIQDEQVIVGASIDEDLGREAGAIYVYTFQDVVPQEQRIQFACLGLSEGLLNDLDFEIRVYRGSTDAACCHPLSVAGSDPVVNCLLNSESIAGSSPPVSCEEFVDLLALEVGSCFDQVSGVLEWRVVSGGSLYVGSDEPIVVGVSSPEITELGQDEIVPLEECGIVNLGDGQSGNELGSPFESGLAIYGPRWRERLYDSNDDCFINADDLIDFIETGAGSIQDGTGTLIEFSTFWQE